MKPIQAADVRADLQDALQAHGIETQSSETVTQTFEGLPLRKLRQLISDGWTVNGVSIQRKEEGGTIQRGAATTGGTVLLWNPVMQLPPVGKMLLWDAEDTESTDGPWQDIAGALEGIGGNRDLHVGDEVTLLCAIEQPSYTLRITSIPGEDSFERFGYELVGPVAPAAPVPLTDEQIQKVWDVASGAIPGWSRHIAYARAIEAAHGIKETTE